MNNTVYTIGYSSFNDIDDFLHQLKLNNINVLIDVRSKPISSDFYQSYSRSYLEPYLKSHNIIYRNYATEFGARQEDPYYYENGYLNFKKFRQSKNFKNGVDKIKKGLELGYNFTLMCAEKDPIMCHRTIMVSKGLKDNGLNIKHILYDGSIQTQNQIEERLVNIFFPNRCQLTLFETKSDNDYIEEAYELQNEKIGYKKELLEK